MQVNIPGYEGKGFVKEKTKFFGNRILCAAAADIFRTCPR
jgi:hypothetical protein